MKQYSSVQRTLEQGLVLHLKYTKQPSHAKVGLRLGQPHWREQTWLSQTCHLTHAALLLPGLQLPPLWRGVRDSSGISLPQR